MKIDIFRRKKLRDSPNGICNSIVIRETVLLAFFWRLVPEIILTVAFLSVHAVLHCFSRADLLEKLLALLLYVGDRKVAVLCS